MRLRLRAGLNHWIAIETTGGRRNEYVNSADGLRFPRNGLVLPHHQRLAVPRGSFGLEIMTSIGPTFRQIRIGAKVVVVKKPGFFLGIVPTNPRQPLRGVTIGGRATTRIDEKIVQRKPWQINRARYTG
ncbi:hypothetical protein KKD61_04335 [Patescibacteria group bacterium]|nr:hypothetical protein [Patescibacteria group bacterium]